MLVPADLRPASAHSSGSQAEVEKAGSRRPGLFSKGTSVRTLSEVFDDWARDQPPGSDKIIDEWRVGVRRFVCLFGDRDVCDIDWNMVTDFREAMRRMPTRPRREVASLRVMEQIKLAEAEKLPRLAGPTVAKLMSGLRITLEHARDPLKLIQHNPASGVKVANSKSDIDARLPFSDEDLKTIFADGSMTDPNSSWSDAEFWLQLLAPLTGLRLEEIGKLRPENIRCERNVWYIAVERDRRIRRAQEESDGAAAKRAKTESSYRHVAVHWLLIEAGFITFAQARQSAGSAWLLEELDTSSYGSRTKSVSRRLIRHYRALGIADLEKVFHSFRHSMKRAYRESEMKEEIGDLLTGHAPASIGRKYGAGAGLSTLKSAIDLIEYHEIDWDPVIAAARARAQRACSAHS